jgi:hypothetical protein
MSQNEGSKLQDSRENTWSFRRNLPAVVLAVAGGIRLLLDHLRSFYLPLLNYNAIVYDIL